ncbi:MAG: ATP-binding cassette domain-containing protein, partial [Planctomycetota bacterium]
MIRLEHVRKEFGKKIAVEDLSLAIPKGEIFGLLGPNGAGKTTTIKMICGLLKPTQGAIQVCGLDVSEKYVEVKQRM